MTCGSGITKYSPSASGGNVANRNDSKQAKLKQLTGSSNNNISDLQSIWLSQQAGVTAKHVSDKWYQFTGLQGALGSLNDRYYSWLGGQGFFGSLARRWAQWWSF